MTDNNNMSISCEEAVLCFDTYFSIYFYVTKNEASELAKKFGARLIEKTTADGRRCLIIPHPFEI